MACIQCHALSCQNVDCNNTIETKCFRKFSASRKLSKVCIMATRKLIIFLSTYIFAGVRREELVPEMTIPASGGGYERW